MPNKWVAFLFILTVAALQTAARAHDLPGQPSHVLSEDPDAPPAVQIETHIGAYHVILMASPASPQPDERGTLTLSVFRSDNEEPFVGRVTFKAIADSLFSEQEETIGVQFIRDDVYEQGFLFKEAGDYIIRAEFDIDGQPSAVDLPLTIGRPSSLGTIGVVIALLLIALVAVNMLQRRRLQRMQAAASST